jgi:hypothetical protein
LGKLVSGKEKKSKETIAAFANNERKQKKQ